MEGHTALIYDGCGRLRAISYTGVMVVRKHVLIVGILRTGSSVQDVKDHRRERHSVRVVVFDTSPGINHQPVSRSTSRYCIWRTSPQRCAVSSITTKTSFSAWDSRGFGVPSTFFASVSWSAGQSSRSSSRVSTRSRVRSCPGFLIRHAGFASIQS